MKNMLKTIFPSLLFFVTIGASAQAQSASSCSSTSVNGATTTSCYSVDGFRLYPTLGAYVDIAGNLATQILPNANAAVVHFNAGVGYEEGTLGLGRPGAVLVVPAVNLFKFHILPAQASNFVLNFSYSTDGFFKPGTYRSQTVFAITSGTLNSNASVLRVSLEAPGTFGLFSNGPILAVQVSNYDLGKTALFAVPGIINRFGPGIAYSTTIALLRDSTNTFQLTGTQNGFSLAANVVQIDPTTFQPTTPAIGNAFAIPLVGTSLGGNTIMVGNSALPNGISSKGFVQYSPIAPSYEASAFAFQGILGTIAFLPSDQLPQAYPFGDVAGQLNLAGTFFNIGTNTIPTLPRGGVNTIFSASPTMPVLLQGGLDAPLSGLGLNPGDLAFATAPGGGFSYNAGSGVGEPNLGYDAGGTQFFTPSPSTQDSNYPEIPANPMTGAPSGTFDQPTGEPAETLTIIPY